MTGKAFFVLMLFLAGSLLVVGSLYRKERNRNRRFKANQEVLFSEAKYYRTRDSLSACGVERLTLSNREFKQYCKNLEKTVDELNLKVKRLQSVSRTATEITYHIETVVRDSVIPGRMDTLRCIDFRDAYLTFVGCHSDGKFIGDVISRDTLDQVVHRVPRRLWFIRFGCKAVRQEVVSRNPYTKIVYTEYIELER